MICSPYGYYREEHIFMCFSKMKDVKEKTKLASEPLDKLMISKQ